MNSADEVMRIVDRVPETLRALSKMELDRQMAKWPASTPRL